MLNPMTPPDEGWQTASLTPEHVSALKMVLGAELDVPESPAEIVEKLQNTIDEQVETIEQLKQLLSQERAKNKSLEAKIFELEMEN